MIAEVLPLPSDRRARLKELESVIASGFHHVVEVGQALREIRDDRLYRELGGDLTFEQYVQSRWSLMRNRAYQYLDAAEIHEAVSTNVDITPLNTEWAARELAPLLRRGGKPLVAEAWGKVAERYAGQRPPTAREVHDVLVEEGYRERTIGPSSGSINRRIRLGQFGDKLIAASKRLDYFVDKELGDKPLGKTEQAKADEYRAIVERMAGTLKLLADGEVPE